MVTNTELMYPIFHLQITTLNLSSQDYIKPTILYTHSSKLDATQTISIYRIFVRGHKITG